MTKLDETIRVVIPLNIRKRNGRPKIVPPQGLEDQEARSQDPHILKALGRAWAWRRRLEAVEAITITDIAKGEALNDRFVSRIMRLAHLSPDVLERLVISRETPSASVNELIAATYLPWGVQKALTLNQEKLDAAIGQKPQRFSSSTYIARAKADDDRLSLKLEVESEWEASIRTTILK